MTIYLLSFMLSFVLSLYLTPLMRKAALKFGIVDKPDGRLKKQQEPVAYLGGLAVYISFLVTVALTYSFDQQVLGLLLGGTLVLLLGLIDDLGVLSPYVKLMGQCLSAFVLVKAGIRIQIVALPEWVSLPLSFLWLVALTNAFNMIDIMDGLAAGIACICSMMFFYVAFVNGRPMIGIMCISMAGALAGFVKFNFCPAKIYLGDMGSLFVGSMIASLSMIGSYTEHNRWGFIAPIIILGVPIFDMLFVSYVRWKRGMSILLGSSDHFALRLRKWRLTTAQTVLSSYGLGIVLGLTGIAILYLSPIGTVMAVCGIIALSLGLAVLLKKIDMSL